jgi:hypothetical protein
MDLEFFWQLSDGQSLSSLGNLKLLKWFENTKRGGGSSFT